MVLAERAADHSNRLAGNDAVAVSQLEWLQVDPVRLHLEQSDIGERVEADDLGRDDVAVLELDEDPIGRLAVLAFAVADYVGVGDDLAVVAQHETRSAGCSGVERPAGAAKYR